MLELRGVSKAHGTGAERVRIIEDFDLRVDSGQCVAVIGASGSGKSTLLNLAGGLDDPDGGQVLIDGADVASLSVNRRARMRRTRLGFVFQMFHLIPSLTVAENVGLPLVLDGRRDRDAAVRAALDRVGVGHCADRYPGQISGGELQRAAVARATINEPALVLADEPTGNLDQDTAGPVLDLLFGAVRDAGAALLIVTHDLGIAERADHTIRFERRDRA